MPSRKKIVELQKMASSILPNEEICIKGWVRTIRSQKSFSFINLNDGSTFSGIQVVVDGALPDYNSIIDTISTGAALAVVGKWVKSPGKEQSYEIHASHVTLVGSCPSDTYPLQKKRHSLEFLRSIAHLRPRTNTIGAVTRVRNAIAFATHRFFQEKGFFYLHSPILTASDCEGAGTMFQTTTLNLASIPKKEDGSIDFEEDFFKRSAFLTVSGQLEAEAYALALSDVYTFGPTFRAENSNTPRHLAEFWMIEPEMAFADLTDNMDNMEEYLRYVVKVALKECSEDMAFFDQWVEKGLLQRLEHVVNAPFERISYTDAIALLEKAPQSFTFPIHWGVDLQTEHERYLSEHVFKKPLFVTDYPKEIKAFYMRANDDGKTVAAVDALVPKVGEIIGGSQREERYDLLTQRIQEEGLNYQDYWWYLELRQFGSTPHAGYGVGFERLIRFITGIENIRDVIPFPRHPGSIDF